MCWKLHAVPYNIVKNIVLFRQTIFQVICCLLSEHYTRFTLRFTWSSTPDPGWNSMYGAWREEGNWTSNQKDAGSDPRAVEFYP